MTYNVVGSRSSINESIIYIKKVSLNSIHATRLYIDFLFSLFKKDFIYLVLERGREREREGEKHPCMVASHAPPTGDLAYSPGMCPD